MIKKSITGIIAAGFLLICSCSSFIPEEESERVTLKYQAGEYVLQNDIDRNGEVFQKGTFVKLIVITSDDWVKVYAYNSGEELLASKRFLILYLFEDDFPDKKYSREYLETELLKVVRFKDLSDKTVSETKKKKNTEKRKKQKK